MELSEDPALAGEKKAKKIEHEGSILHVFLQVELQHVKKKNLRKCKSIFLYLILTPLQNIEIYP